MATAAHIAAIAAGLAIFAAVYVIFPLVNGWSLMKTAAVAGGLAVAAALLMTAARAIG
jgi:hypothetical protein